MFRFGTNLQFFTFTMLQKVWLELDTNIWRKFRLIDGSQLIYFVIFPGIWPVLKKKVDYYMEESEYFDKRGKMLVVENRGNLVKPTETPPKEPGHPNLFTYIYAMCLCRLLLNMLMHLLPKAQTHIVHFNESKTDLTNKNKTKLRTGKSKTISEH